tara:strand:+ start:1112 stop:1354 length:243 start_codon:yes stop_codon:yes gene_type:complete
MIINIGTITTDNASTAVTFDVEHDKTPQVVVSLAKHGGNLTDDVNTYVADLTTKGFTLKLSAEVGVGVGNVTFDYHSVSM